ncbi:hypothetical protein, partial [Fusobacterium necrophorum]
CSLARLFFTSASNSDLFVNENLPIFRKTSLSVSMTSSTSMRCGEWHLGCLALPLAYSLQ